MIHYHGTPITPISVLETLAGCHFCVSFVRPDNVIRCHDLGQSVMLDNGAFSYWRAHKANRNDWEPYYEWTDVWLQWPTTWAVIPDVVDGGVDRNDQLLAQWPYKDRGAPVWHVDEPVSRILRLCDNWPKVCVGSAGEFASVGSKSWRGRMDKVFATLHRHFGRIPWLHMLRGMKLSGEIYPFASVDSTDVARNHHRPHNQAKHMAQEWDGIQCPGRWEKQPVQLGQA